MFREPGPKEAAKLCPFGSGYAFLQGVAQDTRFPEKMQKPPSLDGLTDGAGTHRHSIQPKLARSLSKISDGDTYGSPQKSVVEQIEGAL